MKFNKSKILILGANGLFGNTIFRYLKSKNFNVWGGISSKKDIKYFNKKKLLFFKKIKTMESLKNFGNSLEGFLMKNNINYIINCIGFTTHQKNINYENKKIINSKFPQLISKISQQYDFKFIHVSTDCVFNGNKGNYVETDKPNDFSEYSLTKRNGEIKDNINTITLRTSGIGHELYKKNNLLEWFLAQKNRSIDGYKNNFFSGPTTLEIGKIIEKIIKSKIFKYGLFHISGKKISKLNLLIKINNVYKNNTKIIPKKTRKLDRSLNSSKFRKMYNYKLKNWNILLKELKRFNEKFL